MANRKSCCFLTATLVNGWRRSLKATARTNNSQASLYLQLTTIWNYSKNIWNLYPASIQAHAVMTHRSSECTKLLSNTVTHEIPKVLKQPMSKDECLTTEIHCSQSEGPDAKFSREQKPESCVTGPIQQIHFSSCCKTSMY